MRIIIAGDGETGTHLAHILSVESQDIILMGLDREHLADLDAVSNFITFEGGPMSRDNLMQCGADTADLFVAVTPDETVNLLSCLIAKDCGTRRCVARIDNPEFASRKGNDMLARHGIDMTIYPERLAAAEIHRFIEHNWVSDWFEIHGGAITVVGVRMQSTGSMCGRPLKEIPNSPRMIHVAAIKRGDRMIIPRGDDLLLEGDTVYFSLIKGGETALPRLCGSSPAKVGSIMITGAGRVTENLLRMIGHRYNITVIDPDRKRCNTIAAGFPWVVTVNASANDIATLREEGIEHCDMLLALTGSSETNIVTCMVAREHGVGKTVARIEELQYMPEAESLSIDKIINKKLLNTGKILSVLIDSSVSAAQCISLGAVEITELITTPGSAITRGPVASLSLPRQMTVAGIIRDGVGMLAEGRTMIAPGDHVVVFYEPGALNKVTRFFQ